MRVLTVTHTIWRTQMTRFAMPARSCGRHSDCCCHSSGRNVKISRSRIFHSKHSSILPIGIWFLFCQSHCLKLKKKNSVCMSEMTTWWEYRKSLRQKSTFRSRFTLRTNSLSNMSVPAVLNWSSNFKRPRTVPAIYVTNTGYRHWLTSWRRYPFDTTTFLMSKHTFFPSQVCRIENLFPLITLKQSCTSLLNSVVIVTLWINSLKMLQKFCNIVFVSIP
jgi:hypothetical protein